MDSVIKSDIHFQPHTGVITHRQTQPTESLILSRNSELRKNPGTLRDLGAEQAGGAFGRQIASIPIIMYEKACRDGYDLNSKDAKFAAKEMQRFLSTTEGKMCLVQAPQSRLFTSN